MASRSSSGSPRQPCPMSATRCSSVIVSASTPEHPQGCVNNQSSKVVITTSTAPANRQALISATLAELRRRRRRSPRRWTGLLEDPVRPNALVAKRRANLESRVRVMSNRRRPGPSMRPMVPYVYLWGQHLNRGPARLGVVQTPAPERITKSYPPRRSMNGGPTSVVVEARTPRALHGFAKETEGACRPQAPHYIRGKALRGLHRKRYPHLRRSTRRNGRPPRSDPPPTTDNHTRGTKSA
jgi:hypothetical protein